MKTIASLVALFVFGLMITVVVASVFEYQALQSIHRGYAADAVSPSTSR